MRVNHVSVFVTDIWKHIASMLHTTSGLTVSVCKLPLRPKLTWQTQRRFISFSRDINLMCKTKWWLSGRFVSLQQNSCTKKCKLRSNKWKRASSMYKDRCFSCLTTGYLQQREISTVIDVICINFAWRHVRACMTRSRVVFEHVFSVMRRHAVKIRSPSLIYANDLHAYKTVCDRQDRKI